MKLWYRCVPVAALLAAAVPDGTAAQQYTTRSCDADDVVAWIGIQALDCNCTVKTSGEPGRIDPDAEWSFRSEPVVREVTEGSPADGVLRPGDVIVAVNGALITTAAGGRRFTERRPGRTMTFTIRRDGRTQTVRLTPIGLCPGDARINPIATPRVAADGMVAPDAVAPPVSPRTPRPEVPRTSQEPAPAPVMTPSQTAPTGRLGFAFSCSNCGWERERGADESRWYFSTPPEIYNVDPGSPADRAGLRRGDVVTHVDGVDIVSAAGAQRFGGIRPGQRVRLSYRRGARTGIATLQADDRPGPADLAATAESLGRQLEELLRTNGTAAELQRQVRSFLQQLGSLEASASEAPAGTGQNRSNTLRYSGRVGDAEIEVRGSGSVITSILEPGRDLVIVLDGARIRIRVPDRDERDDDR